MPPAIASQLSAESDRENYVSFRSDKNPHRRRLFRLGWDLSDFWGTADGVVLGESFGWIFLLPVVGQQFIEVASWIFGEPLNNVGQV